MERRRTSVWLRKPMFWIVCFLVAVAEAKVAPSHSSSPLTVSSAHRYYTCPEGVTAKLVCNQKNANLHPDHHVRDLWLFTPHTDLHCKKGETPRNVSHKPRNSNLGVEMNYTNENMWVILRNVTHADQGRYCCIALDVKIDHKQQTAQQSTHSHIILQVTPKRDGVTSCTFWDPTPPPAASVPVALALAACILALLSLPLILVLVYKQRENSRSNRRGQELVRMDSEAQGHENPVFLIGSPQVKTRTVSQIMTRQPSETSRHLLSDPGTPLSPPAHGDVFFPSEDVIPENPDLVQI
ncbi:V-type immunoglobulin domain-containing suppressor of T-cell activation isoform X1 [Xiphophorus couchianus]|uniref:V-type immunoglobulin domain-containing suppressor of T-cell activation isoform X1 n=1 Tax=Xiphophorus couchianus TaxID=32473 RepID=UPI001016FE68|nr:V-type immunoglobulin domain-containing suppressor of T-cell activation isoform X1 [Xiphophorus couchianus]